MSNVTSERQPAPRINLRGVQKFLNVVEAPQIEKRRLLGLLVAMAVAIVLLSLGMMRMLPLKERIPYVLRVEVDAKGHETGKVEVSESGVAAFKPTEAHTRYFLGKWAIDLLSIDERSKEVRLPATYALMKGQGIKDWRDYVNGNAKPLQVLTKNPDFRQRAELISIAFLTEETALIRVKLTSNNGRERRVQLTLNYATLPPTTDADVYRNPIGLWITTFGVNDELV